MRRRHELVSLSCCLSGLVLVLLLLALSARAQRQAQTDPSEVFLLYTSAVASLNAIFSRWGLRASTAWNINGEPCSGAAIDNTDIDNDHEFNPAIKCICSYNASTICHITRLKVYRLDVVGQIPAELQNLTYLTNLYELFPPNLAQNYLTGSLPTFLEKLAQLQYLHLGTNALTGVLPRELGNLENLISLRLHGNNFDGPIPASFSNLVNMTNLRIGDLTGEVSSLAFVANMTLLKTLVLRNSRISDNLASADFSKFVNLNYLDLSFNSITGKVSPTLLNLNTLNFLFLGSNNLSGSLPDMISPSLTTM
nr:probable LRR receptor-like serine/threonine-protein kinase At1g56130 [Aegilops tauschii subsp. strangulata]